MKRLLALILICGITATGWAQDSENGKNEKWDVNNPGWETKQVTFTTDEGTWMNLDVSPDGQTIVFDMMGDIYTMPVSGGKATPLRQGMAYEIQPRFSPDGSQISFTSDAGGGDNIWIMDTDGSNAHQVTDESFRLLNNAVWSPEGDYIIAKKHFSSTRSLGSGELWLYHLSGGSGIQLVEKPNAQQDLGQPFVSPDGRYVYYSQAVYPGGYFQYNKDPNSQIYAINRYDRETGEIERITGGSGGAISPTISPDGSKMAFIRRVRTKSVLYIKDLESGVERPVYDQLSKDQQEAWAIFGPYTNFDWMPDNEHLVFYAQGKIHKLNTQSLESEIIPFEVNANHEVAETVSFQNDPAPDTFTAKAIRHAITSPDGELLVFNAAGYLWTKKLPNGTPERLTEGDALEFDPSFSKDGEKLLFTTWSDTEKGKIKVADLSRRRVRFETLTEKPGIYREPRFSPDGSMIVFRKESGNYHQGFAHTEKPGIYTMTANGDQVTLVTERGQDARFSADGKRLFFEGGSYLDNAFVSVDLSGNDQRTYFTGKYTNNFVISPDNKWVAFNELFKVYVAPMPKAGQDITLNAKTTAIPVAQVAEDAGISLHWSGDSRKLQWTLGEKYYSVSLRQAFDFIGGKVESDLPLATKEGTDIGLTLDHDKPEGAIAFIGGRVITMEGDRVIDNGTVVVEGNRITAVGANNKVEIPRNAKVVDISGKTIMPGIVDVHAHIGNFRQGQSPQQQWEYLANLAYGVTTAHDPSSNTEMIFSQSEMVKAGNMIGPRIFSTGRILYGADAEFKAEINSLDDARSAIRRTKAFGAFSVKSYNQPRREQRQQVIQAARELGILVMPEGGSTFTHNMSMILDGHTGIEHNIPIYPAYKDVQTVWSNSGTGYTPTLVVNYGSISGEYYWYQNTKVWEKERLLNFTPRSIVDARSRHRKMVPQEEYEMGHIESAALAKELFRKGVTVNLGAHGQLQGLGAHWELWMFEQGGMTNLEALQVATINGAKYLGMEHHIGSIKEGKLADLIVIDGNPLQDIRSTEQVEMTMANGRLYDAATLNEIGNRTQKRLPFWWEQQDYDAAFDWHQQVQSSGQHIHCSCGRGRQ